jgi:hypothetical protein
MSHAVKKKFMGHLGHLMYCYVINKACCGGVGGIHKCVLKCHILSPLAG